MRSLQIELDAVALQHLGRHAIDLVVVKAVSTNSPMACPTVWHRAPASERIGLRWEAGVRAWTAPERVAGPVEMSNALDIEPGERFEMRGGLGYVRRGAMPHAVEIFNPSARECVGGLAQRVNGRMNPICTLPLFSGNLVDIEPVPSVAVLFADRAYTVGTPIATAPTNGLLIDAIDAATVRWHPRSGWSVSGAGAIPIRAGAALRPLMAGPPALEESVRRRQAMHALGSAPRS